MKTWKVNTQVKSKRDVIIAGRITKIKYATFLRIRQILQKNKPRQVESKSKSSSKVMMGNNVMGKGFKMVGFKSTRICRTNAIGKYLTKKLISKKGWLKFVKGNRGYMNRVAGAAAGMPYQVSRLELPAEEFVIPTGFCQDPDIENYMDQFTVSINNLHIEDLPDLGPEIFSADPLWTPLGSDNELDLLLNMPNDFGDMPPPPPPASSSTHLATTNNLEEASGVVDDLFDELSAEEFGSSLQMLCIEEVDFPNYDDYDYNDLNLNGSTAGHSATPTHQNIDDDDQVVDDAEIIMYFALQAMGTGPNLPESSLNLSHFGQD